MNTFRLSVLTAAVLLMFQTGIAAQDTPEAATKTMGGPPKVLVITREFLKPGRSGEAHKKAEAAFVRAMSSAKSPTHYLAVTSLSGRPRALFFTPYDSFEAWEKDAKDVEKNPTLSHALDQAAMSDGDLLSDIDGGVFLYREDYSLNPGIELAHMRYFEVAQFHIKPGHDKEWDEGVKMVLKAYQQIPDTHFVCYQVMYGAHDGTYLFFTPLKSAADVDREIAHNKDFMAALGDDGMKKLSEMSAASIEWSETNLFAFDPGMSYASQEWIKADPDFWTPKMMTKTAMKTKSRDKSGTAERKPPE
jgi:hypothetical protein